MKNFKINLAQILNTLEISKTRNSAFNYKKIPKQNTTKKS